MSTHVTWKEPKLYKAKDKWFLGYQFRIPEELRYRYKVPKWKGFRVYEDINRHETDEYADLLLTETIPVVVDSILTEKLKQLSKPAGPAGMCVRPLLTRVLHTMGIKNPRQPSVLQKHFYWLLA